MNVKELSLKHRILALTGSFETGKSFPDCFGTVSGNFDKQGMSWGVLQFNLGQGTLQPLLKKIIEMFPDTVELQDLNKILQKPKGEQIKWASSNVRSGSYWWEFFQELGLNPIVQKIQLEAADHYFKLADHFFKELQLYSARGYALVFDCAVQNGGIKYRAWQDIQKLFNTMKKEGKTNQELEVSKMVIIANQVAEHANTKWIEDVRSRKLCIARGYGLVHGRGYVLDEWGIGLQTFSNSSA